MLIPASKFQSETRQPVTSSPSEAKCGTGGTAAFWTASTRTHLTSLLPPPRSRSQACPPDTDTAAYIPFPDKTMHSLPGTPPLCRWSDAAELQPPDGKLSVVADGEHDPILLARTADDRQRAYARIGASHASQCQGNAEAYCPAGAPHIVGRHYPATFSTVWLNAPRHHRLAVHGHREASDVCTPARIYSTAFRFRLANGTKFQRNH